VSQGSSFRFRLERVRALRERREDLARQELAAAMTRLAGSRDRLRAVEERLEQLRAEQRASTGPAQVVTAADLCAQQAFVEHVETQRAGGTHELTRHEAAVAQRGSELGRAARERQTLERLRDRQRAEHDREARRREDLALDEIAIERFRRSAA
jgi:flagellar FliJ protein